MSATHSAKEVLTAMRDFGADVKTIDGWDRGRTPEWRGVINHHTATASASLSNPDPSLWWLLNAYDKPAAHMLVGKKEGHTWFAGVDSYHCGMGGPWKDAGIPAGNYPQYMLGIEIDDPGVKVGTLTDYQIENTAKINAAMVQLFRWPISRIITHGCWTNGCHGVNPDGPSANLGRKNDTLEGAWRQWPGSNKSEPYNAPWWREQALYFLNGGAGRQAWDGTVPTRTAAQKAFEGLNNVAAKRLADRLHDMGFKDTPGAAVGKQKYPVAAVKRARVAFGWQPGTGAPSANLWRRLFGVDKP